MASVASTLFKHSERLNLVKVVQRPQHSILPPEYVSTNPVGNEFRQLVSDVFTCWHGEYVVEFFQGALFGFYIMVVRRMK
jgi:hypothetical protein